MAVSDLERLKGTLDILDPKAEVAALYDRRYQQATAGLFSRSKETPLLKAFNRGLSRMRGTHTALDVGTGSGVHAIDIALNVPRTEVKAIDTSYYAITRLHEALANLGFIGQSRMRFMGSRVIPWQGDIADYLGRYQPNAFHGIHGNSWGHFLPDQMREDFYDTVFDKLVPEGLLAISQKDRDDALLHQPSTVIIGEDDKGIRATPVDGITRIFYRTADAAAAEMQKAGFRIRDVFKWSAGGYDFPQQPDLKASFVGVLAQKP